MNMQRPKIKSPISFVFSFVKPYWVLLTFLVVLFFLQSAFTSIQPLIIAPIIDIVLGQNSTILNATESIPASQVDLNTLVPFVSEKLGLSQMDPWSIIVYLAGIYLVISFFLAVLNFSTLYLTTKIRVQAFRDMQYRLFDHLLSLSLDYFSHKRIGEIMSRFENDTRNSVESLATTLQNIITSILLISIYGYLLVKTNLGLSLLVAATAALQGFLGRALKQGVQNRVRDQFDVLAQAGAYIQEIFTNIRVVKSFAAERYELSRFKVIVDKILPITLRFALYKHVQTPLNVAVNGIANVAILLLATSQLLNGNLTVAGFALFIFLGRELLGPINQLTQAYVSIQMMSASAERIIDIFNSYSLVQDGPKLVKKFEGEIRFENVTFSYEDQEVLSDVSFNIRRGEIVALVGPSGAGKSTITDLLMRFYDPTKGKITLDGVDLRDMQISPFRKMFGVVAQENLLFNSSVASNIAYGREEIKVEQVERAAHIANAWDFIEAMPDGFETFVGDRGVRVSGGQRQRIAIARAVLNHPAILIMDEATSSLDTESERLVQDAIDRVISDTTAVVIAHRLSTVVNADQIIVLDRGRIVDKGKHTELISRCDLYRKLAELQFNSNVKEAITAS
jgi:ATP-binding cassette, subfamily B, bacterial MsbA